MNLSTLPEVSLTVSHEVKPLQKNQNSDSLNRTKKCLTGPPSNKKKRKINILVLFISLSIADSTFSEKIGQKNVLFWIIVNLPVIHDPQEYPETN